MKLINLIFGTLFLTILFFQFYLVDASLAIKPSYTGDGSILMNPGEEKELFFSVLNVDSQNEVIVETELVSGSGIATVEPAGNLIIPAGGEKKINLKLKIEEDELAGTHDVRLLFRPVSLGNAEGVQILANIGEHISVIVSGEVLEEEINEEAIDEKNEELDESPPVKFYEEFEIEKSNFWKDNLLVLIASAIVLILIIYIIRKST